MKINKVPSKTKSTILVLVDNKHVLTFPIQVLMPKLKNKALIDLPYFGLLKTPNDISSFNRHYFIMNWPKSLKPYN